MNRIRAARDFLRTKITPHRLSIMPLYAFLLLVLVFAGGRRLTALVAPASDERVQTDCESICNQFEVCMAKLVTAEVVAQHRWMVQAGCRNGCHKQRELMGQCFENHPSCDQAQACIFGHLKANM